MKRASVLLAGVLAAMFVVCGAVLAQPSKAVDPPDRYIVVLKKGASDPGRVANEMARRYRLGVGFVYSHALEGFSAVIPEGRLGAVRADERVKRVEPDETYHAVSQTLPWGINKIDADTSSTIAGNGSGSVSNVNAYVIDSGIYAHADLNVVKNVNRTGDGKNTDCYGHGTHIAGTIAAKDNASAVVGAAPGAPLTGVKVLGCDGSGTKADILEGVNWVTANAKKPAIANMSLSGPNSQILNDAVKKSADSGVFYSIAAGNDGANACNYSPAGAGSNNGIVTTAATDKYDREPSWSNYGSCVDIWAPGVEILSTWKKTRTDKNPEKKLRGTSQAAAHIGGGAALYLHSHTSATPQNVESALKNAAWQPGTKSKNGSPILLEKVGAF